MLINFIGCPQSGKTTTAAMTFSSMKETGMIAEFCPEQARFYIAQERIRRGLSPQDRFSLGDEDQIRIMAKQVEIDEVFVRACGPDVFIVSDSSPLNSMLYMSREAWTRPEVLDLARRALAITSFTFYATPIDRPYLQDPNRIHDEQQSRLVDTRIPELLSAFPELKSVTIWGTIGERLAVVQDRVFFANRT